MKKLVLMFVAVAAISFASCGNKAAQTEANVDSLEVTVDSLQDSVATDSTAAVDSTTAANDSVAQ